MKTAETLRNHAAEQLNRKVSRRLTAQFRRYLPEALIRRALQEARESAEETGWPHLVFPVLAEETVSRMMAVAVPGVFGLAEAA